MSEPSKLYPCPGCGKPYLLFDPKEWHSDPGTCRDCRSCPDCKTLFKDVQPHSQCATCRQNWCMEHSADRRGAFHIIMHGHCQPGEW